MEEKPDRNLLSKSLSGITDIFSKKQNKETPIALPPIAPLETKANITDTWEAVERFPSCLLLTDPILSNERESYNVKEVIFNITSNDQGWCNEDNFEGIYEGSWSWFEVAILRPVKEGVRISPRDKQSINSEPFIKKFLEEQKISSRLSFVINPNEGIPFWHLQRNRRGNSEPYPHTITWTQDSKESESESLGWDFNAKDGSGSGVNFVKSLQRGDRVMIIARAKQSGSVNYIAQAKIQIRFEGFEATPTAAPDPTQVTNPEQPGELSANTAMTRGDPNFTLKSSIAKSTQADVKGPYLDVPRPTGSPLPSSPTSNDSNPELPRATSLDAARAQAEDQTQAVVDKGTGAPPSKASTEITRPTVPSDTPEAGLSDAGVALPAPPKTEKSSQKGSNGWNRFNKAARKKGSTGSMKPNPATDSGVQSRSVDPVDSLNSQPIVGADGQEVPLTRVDFSARAQSIQNLPTVPSSPISERLKLRFGGWARKAKKLTRGKTSTTLASDVDKVEASEAGSSA